MSALRLCLAVAVVSLPVFILVDHIVPNPYMDEIFHIPQTQQYCKGNFKSWDPMITTPPGLYLFSYIYTLALRFGIKSFEEPPSLPDLCSPTVLRSINVALAMTCAVLFRAISLHIEPNSGPKAASLKAFALACYPVHWFFTFLFYTDVGSTTAVMAMYLSCLKNAYWSGSILGIVAILFRQTNVIWVTFVACVVAIDFLYNKKQEAKVDQKQIPNHFRAGLFDELLFLLQEAWENRVALLERIFPLTLPVIFFIIFVVLNGGIVLGAKEAHKVSPHFAQPLYFGAVGMLAMAPVHFDLNFMRQNIWKLSTAMQSGIRKYLIASLVAGLASVHFFSQAHPYLLADNRHYTFYIWRKILNAHSSAKYVLVFIYIYSWYSILQVLGNKQPRIWLLVLFGAILAVLVPTPLIEFRYYTLPFYFIALHVQVKRYSQWVFIILSYVFVNFVTMYIFLFKPFYWHNEIGAQRFIW